MNPIYQKLKEAGREDLVDFLSKELTASQLNSLLIEVFHKRAYSKPAAEVLRDYKQNRFVQPSSIDPIHFAKQELQLLEIASNSGFEPIEYSPLAPMGTVATHKTVNQNHIVSTTRRCEVVSDITNVMSLEIAKRVQEDSSLTEIHLASAHRHVRAQPLLEAYHTAHFKIFALASGWQDGGNMEIDQRALLLHISTYVQMLKATYQINSQDIGIQLMLSHLEHEAIQRIVERVKGEFSEQKVIVGKLDVGYKYYWPMRFQISIHSMGATVIDGGFVDWASRLTQNKKRRTLISGMGTEIMHKMLSR